MKLDNTKKCSECQKNDAAVLYREIINGCEKRYSLCRECAKKKESASWLELSSPFKGGMFESFFAPVGNPQKKVLEKRCTLCGSTFKELTRLGRVGCTKCYEVFSQELSPTLHRLHSRVEHKGRTPSSFKKESGEDEITILEGKLKDAIGAENYEEAAVIRDKIRSLRKEREGGE